MEVREVARREPQESLIQGDWGPHTVGRAEDTIRILKGLREVFVGQYLNPEDVTRLGREPYMGDSACMKAAQIFGVSLENAKIEQTRYEDERGPVIAFHAEVTARFRDRIISDVGEATTADQFFNGSEEAEDGTKRTRRLPLSEVPVVNVRKKAMTNAQGRAIRKILSLKFSWEELEAAWGRRGKSTKGVTRVAYGGKSQAREATGKGADSDVKVKLSHALLAMGDGDMEAAKDLLKYYTVFTGKEGEEKFATSVRDMSEKWAFATWGKVKPDYEVWLQKHGGNEGSNEQDNPE